MNILRRAAFARVSQSDIGSGRRRHRSSFDALEERCVLSGGHNSALSHALTAHRGAHAPQASAAVAPAAAVPFQVQWTFPGNGQALTGAPGFIAVGFSQLPDWTTATHQNVQLAHQNTDGSWTPIPSAIWVNPSNNTVVMAPLGLQPNGLYVVALYAGLHSTTGASIGGPIYESFSINDTWGTQDPITAFPADNGTSGVVVADQSRRLDPTTVNGNTVQVYQLNADGSRGAQIPVTIVYDPETPTIELALRQGLQAGTYQFVEHGVHDLVGNVLTATITRNFTVTTSQVAPGPDTLPDTPIAVSATFPRDGATLFDSSLASITFNQAPVPSTVNTNTIQLVRWLPGQNTWSNPLPISVTNNGLHTVTIIPTASLSPGSYLIAVHGVMDQLGRTMPAPQYFHWTLADGPVFQVDARNMTTFPAFGQTSNGAPPAILVFLHKYAGDVPASINASNVQLRPWLGDHLGRALPIGVAYNPWPGEIVISPFFPMGDGPYVIQVNGITDIGGFVQNGPFSSWFNVTGTGRPQST